MRNDNHITIILAVSKIFCDCLQDMGNYWLDSSIHMAALHLMVTCSAPRIN